MVEHVKNGVWNSIWMKAKKYRYPALILALGLLLLLLPTGTKRSTADTETTASSEDEFDLDAFTKETETLLSGIQGAGEVKLLLTLETDGQKDYLSDSTSSQGQDQSQSQTQAVLVDGSDGESPVVITRSYPKFRGAVVLCQGESPTLTLSMKEALSSLTGLGMDKITVLKSN